LHQKKKHSIHNTKGKQLYFLALIPNESLADQITELKLFCAKNFNSSHALKSPPHITIVPPFRVSKDELVLIMDRIKNSVKEVSPFKVRLKDFNHFGNKVIFIDVPFNHDLNQFHLKVHSSLLDTTLSGKGFDQRFSPHLTLAFKDLASEVFKEAWAHFKNRMFEAEFEVNQLLLLRHDGQKWDVLRNIPLAEN
jgi:2'-5' RNA ligase